MTRCGFPAPPCASWLSPAKAGLPGAVVSQPMAIPPNPNSSATAAASGLAAIGVWRLLAVAAPHLAALIVMLATEIDLPSRFGFLLSWGILNFFWIALLLSLIHI